MRFKDPDFDWDGYFEAERDLAHIRAIIDRQGYIAAAPLPPRSHVRSVRDSGLDMLTWMFANGRQERYCAQYAPEPPAQPRVRVPVRVLRMNHAHPLYAGRKQLGMSQRQLERLGGFPPAYISAAECGYREPEERYPRFLAALMDERGLEGSEEVRNWHPMPGRTWRPQPKMPERQEAP